ncbi:hypothetical protein BGX30_008614, partial [Mortierella sp. GBA39]
MAWCPYLEDLRVDTNKSILMGGPWFRPPDATRKTPPELRLKPTRLVSQVLFNVRVKHQDLQDLLESQSNVIMSSEIVNGDGHPSEVLTRYLCVSPHLLHLKAPRVGIIVEDMDRPSSSHVDTTKDLVMSQYQDSSESMEFD